MEGKNRSPHFAFRRRRKKNHKPQQLSFLPGLSSASLLTVKSLYIPSLSTWHVYANMSSSIQRKSRLSLSTMGKHFAPSPSRHFPLNAHRLAEAGKAKHKKRHAVWPNKIFKKSQNKETSFDTNLVIWWIIILIMTQFGYVQGRFRRWWCSSGCLPVHCRSPPSPWVSLKSIITRCILYLSCLECGSD